MNNLFNLNNLNNLLYAVGYFGDTISFFIICMLIFNNFKFFIFYVICFIINMYFNNYLTNLIKQKNPSHPIKFLESETYSKKRYGMPSFHSQNMFFSIGYAFFILNNFIWKLILLLIGFAVIYERYVFRDHTMEQLLYGAILGLIIGYIFYLIVKMIKYKF